MEAAVAILRADEPEDSVLLIRRAESPDDSWSGQLCFPGGRRDGGDSDALGTALRELAEECGILLPRDSLETALPLATARRRAGPYLAVAPFVFHVPFQLPSRLDPREAVEARWVPMSVLRDPLRHVLRNIPGFPRDLLFPAVDLEVVPLWGFTYRLITDWLGLASKRPGDGEAAAEEVRRFLRGRGAIDIDEVLAHFRGPSPLVHAINRMQVKADSVTVWGPTYEEYVIPAPAPGPRP